ncbi:hypothetical protein SEA_RYADEL_86 [Mycobacterium phage Ryadel]|uniref:Uncharacterized protein n=2 Tax=Corndogvirus TaxID=1623285 RepID=A0A345MF53_9CAUD|nr:hypothetical protein PBI_CATDAWG_82 [Mycobacterium phage Catdawg]YP_010097576.1 hypothetical protein KNU03_gp086 [Mycobacterium phage Ryadel]ATW60565.1 hypothetical protein SEA_FAMILTON_83 [Mycobacterium phage Familton]AVI04113.1 hypothetical protein SEA_JANGDYNASTY_82 [Mycobacterium phage JangDynasty]AVP42737.1 hypothetical protein SEA_SCHOOLBUS_82 [Mycobacterium phage SchoolBus]AYQ98920.1 hypothetical protein SEA_VORRPS_83 [Mycobacterium phage Vorrps]QFP97128.1 hypothetical protein SEA_K
MKYVLLATLPVGMIVISILVTYIGALRGKVARLEKTLAGVEDPMVWLSDEDRRTYARELLERERAAYQEELLHRQLNNPIIEKKEFPL